MVGDLEGAATEPESPTGGTIRRARRSPTNAVYSTTCRRVSRRRGGSVMPSAAASIRCGSKTSARTRFAGGSTTTGRRAERGQLRIRAKGGESVRGRGASRRRSYAGLPVPPSAI
jgi:hypothetical protein